MEIKFYSRFDSKKIVHTQEIPDATETKWQIKVALELAVKNKANLSGANLSGANLYGANLSGAYLSGAYLSGANLYGANLSGANLSGANLYGANLSDAYLYGAKNYMPPKPEEKTIEKMPDELTINGVLYVKKAD